MLDADLPLVFSRRQATRLGMTDHAISWRIASGTWQPLRRGVFCRTDARSAATPEQVNLLGALAVLVRTGSGEVISHLTAALAYGWWSPLEVEGRPWTTMEPSETSSTRRRQGRIRQVAPLPDDQIVTRRGLSLTSPARTVADCLRHLPAEDAVPIADCAIARGVPLEQVAKIIAWQADWPYAARGHTSLGLVDGRRESWLESRSAVAFQRLDLPQPTPQVTILDDRLHFVGRVDFLWPSLGVVGEADGWGKYSAAGLVTMGSTESEAGMAALRAEKVRQDAIRDLGYEVVRWTLADLVSPQSDLPERWARAAARARPDRLRGSRQGAAWPTVRSLEPTGLDELLMLSRTGRLILPSPPSYARSDGDLAS